MDLNRQSLSGRDIAGALAWWREAGVDLDLGDEPRAWISAPEAEEEPAATPVLEARLAAPPPPRINRGALPATLDAFSAWWLAEPTLDGGMVLGRVAPRGGAGAQLMILVPYPEADDDERLLSGPLGKLVGAMLSAMGIVAEDVYFASVLPRHAPHPDWDALHRDGLGEVLAHHIALVGPKRLIAFGGNILPLLGHDPANSAQTLPEFNHEGRSIPLLPAMDLGVILQNPRRKASFWQRWLDWTG